VLSSLVFLTHFPNFNSCPQRRMKRVAPTHMLHATAAGAYNGCGSGKWTPPPVAGSVSVVAQVLGGVGFAGAMEVGPRTAPLKSAISVRRLFQRGRQLCASDGGGSALGVKEQNCALGSESQCVTCLIVPY